MSEILGEGGDESCDTESDNPVGGSKGGCVKRGPALPSEKQSRTIFAEKRILQGWIRPIF